MKYFSSVFLLLIIATAVNAQTSSKQEKEVADAVSALTLAMVSGDSIKLDAITDEHLMYGHSGGHVDSKKEFVHKLAGGGSDFVTIDITNQTIAVVDNTAIVHHRLDATTNDNNKPGVVKLDILLTFHKFKSGWKLLGRQAVKVKEEGK